jgi:hypothetical protein
VGTITISGVSDLNRAILQQKYPQKPWHRTPECRAYIGARLKCEHPKQPDYESVGGRGIRFLYRDLDHLLADVGFRPSGNHALHRIDRDKDYEPGNVRWVTKFEASRRYTAKPEERFQLMMKRIVRALTKRIEMTRSQLVFHCKSDWTYELVNEALRHLIDIDAVVVVEAGGSTRNAKLFKLKQGDSSGNHTEPVR